MRSKSKIVYAVYMTKGQNVKSSNEQGRGRGSARRARSIARRTKERFPIGLTVKRLRRIEVEEKFLGRKLSKIDNYWYTQAFKAD